MRSTYRLISRLVAVLLIVALMPAGLWATAAAPVLPNTLSSSNINYGTEYITGLDTDWYYVIQNAAGATVVSRIKVPAQMIKIEPTWFGGRITVYEDATATAASSSSLVIPYRDPSPSVSKSRDCTTTSNNNGEITMNASIKNTTEYRIGATGTWVSCQQISLSSFTPGTYYFRTAATSSKFASEPTSQIVVNSFEQMAVAAAATRLVWYNSSTTNYTSICKENARTEVGGYNVVTGDLSLPTTINVGSVSGVNYGNVNVTWSASPTGYIVTSGNANDMGKVTNPTTYDEYVTLTARITKTATSNSSHSGMTDDPFYLVIKAGNDQDVVDAIAEQLVWNDIRSSNASQSNVNNTANSRYDVTANLNLAVPKTIRVNNTNVSTEGARIDWSVSGGTSSATINTTTGIVTFPASGSQNVTLTGTVRKGNATAKSTRTFYLTIVPSDDQSVVNEAIADTTWDRIRQWNLSAASSAGVYTVYSDLNLPTSFVNKDNKRVGITWTSSSTTYVRNDGRVNPTNTAQAVTLTAVFTYGSITSTATEGNPNSRVFNLSVRLPSDSEAVAADRDGLTWDVIKNKNTDSAKVTGNLDLPSAGGNGSTITWESSNTNVVSHNGVVTRPPLGGQNASLTLRATIRKGSTTDNKSINITVLADQEISIVETADGMTATMSRDSFDRLTEGGTRALIGVIRSDLCNIDLDLEAVRTVRWANGDVVVSVTKTDRNYLTTSQRNRIGERPVLDITLSAGNRLISDFGDGALTVTIPYTPSGNENTYAVVPYNIKANGTLEAMRGYYDSRLRAVTFKTKHLSRFAIGYNLMPYTDITGDWARDAIEFIAAREYTVGISSDTYFEPGKALTRGEFTANLMKAYNIEVDPYAWDNFTDVNSNMAYAPYLATAKRMGLVKGTNTAGTTFAPERQIGRAEMFALLYNILEELGEVPAPVSNGRRLSDFTDANEVGEYFRRQIEALLAADKMQGVGSGRLDPRGLCLRRSMAQMIYNLLLD